MYADVYASPPIGVRGRAYAANAGRARAESARNLKAAAWGCASHERLQLRTAGRIRDSINLWARRARLAAIPRSAPALQIAAGARVT